MKRAGALLALAALLPSDSGAAADKPRPFAVYGHRGARARRPENTLPAFEHAVRAGADFVELDLQVTRDRRVVAAHDARLDPALCLGPGGRRLEAAPLVFAMSLKELRGLDCGTLKNPTFPAQRPAPGARVPTLGEVFAAVERLAAGRARPVRYYIEAKSLASAPDDSPPAEEFAALVVAEFRKAGMLERAVLQSFDYRLLAAARALEPRLKIAALCRNPLEDLETTAAELKPDDVALYRPLARAGTVAALHKRGVRVVAWTADEPSEWQALLEAGVDGIITDDPAALVGWLGTRP